LREHRPWHAGRISLKPVTGSVHVSEDPDAAAAIGNHILKERIAQIFPCQNGEANTGGCEVDGILSGTKTLDSREASLRFSGFEQNLVTSANRTRINELLEGIPQLLGFS
jgi:hypothetical protein